MSHWMCWMCQSLINQVTKKRTCLRFPFFPPFLVTTTAILWKQGIFFLFCSLSWQVRKWAQEECQFLILHTAFQRYSSCPYPHVWWPVIALLEREIPLHRKGSFWQTSLCRHCIFMSSLLISAAVHCLPFTFHSYYVVQGLNLHTTAAITTTPVCVEPWGEGEWAEIVRACNYASQYTLK